MTPPKDIRVYEWPDGYWVRLYLEDFPENYYEYVNVPVRGFQIVAPGSIDMTTGLETVPHPTSFAAQNPQIPRWTGMQLLEVSNLDSRQFSLKYGFTPSFLKQLKRKVIGFASDLGIHPEETDQRWFRVNSADRGRFVLPSQEEMEIFRILDERNPLLLPLEDLIQWFYARDHSELIPQYLKSRHPDE